MKKQIAVMMAAATVATTVAPVIANADTFTNTSKDQLVKVVNDALGKKYSDNSNGVKLNETGTGYETATSAVFVRKASDLTKTIDDKSPNYGVALSDYEGTLAKEAGLLPVVDTNYKNLLSNLNGGADGQWYVVTDASAFANFLEKAEEKDKSLFTNLQVAVLDKGVDGDKASRTTDNQYIVKDGAIKGVSLTVKDVKESAEKAYDAMPNLFDGEKSEAITSDGTTLTVKLVGGETLEYTANDDVPNFDQGIQADGKTVVDLSSHANAKSVLEKVASFGTIKMTNDKYFGTKLDVTTGDVNYYNLTNVNETNFDLGTIYTKDNGYTEDGANFVNAIIDAKEKAPFNFRGISYEAKDLKEAIKNAEINAMPDGSYQLKLRFFAVDNNDSQVKRELQFIVSAKNQVDLNNVVNDLKGTAHVVVGKFTKLAGLNRYETAIAVSKAQFDGPGQADSIVIVGGEAVYDGLSAAPLASAVNAPILLANPRTGLSTDTVAEINRVSKDLSKETVYIVGGVNSVPYSVEKQLESMGAVVVRLSGQDRAQTSEEVALKLANKGCLKSKDVFLVGYKGAADAMSIAGVAAKQGSAILVVNKNRVSMNSRDIIKDKLQANRAYIVGGENSVGSQAYLDAQLALVSGNARNVFRVSGDDRYGTNLAVLNTFYGNYSAVVAKKEAQKMLNAKYAELQKAVSAFKTGQSDLAKKIDANRDLTSDKVKTYFEGDQFLSAPSKFDAEAGQKAVKEAYETFVDAYAKGLEKGTKDGVKEATEALATFNTVLSNKDNYDGKTAVKVDVQTTAVQLATLAGDLKVIEDVNAKVVAKLEADKQGVLGAIFASGQDRYLVDAQTSGAFAAAKNAPVVLTNGKLSDAQKGLMYKGGVLYNVRTGIYQVGGVVSADVMSDVVTLLGL